MDRSAWLLLLALLFIGFLYLIGKSGESGGKLIVGAIWIIGILTMVVPTVWLILESLFKLIFA